MNHMTFDNKKYCKIS